MTAREGAAGPTRSDALRLLARPGVLDRLLPAATGDGYTLLGSATVIADMGAQIAYEFGKEIVENYGLTPDGGRAPVRRGAVDGVSTLAMSSVMSYRDLSRGAATSPECAAPRDSPGETNAIAAIDVKIPSWASMIQPRLLPQ